MTYRFDKPALQKVAQGRSLGHPRQKPVEQDRSRGLCPLIDLCDDPASRCAFFLKWLGLAIIELIDVRLTFTYAETLDSV